MNLPMNTTIIHLNSLFPGHALRYTKSEKVEEICEKVRDGYPVSNGNWAMSIDSVIDSIDRDELNQAIFECVSKGDYSGLTRLVEKAEEKQVSELLEWEL